MLGMSTFASDGTEILDVPVVDVPVAEEPDPEPAHVVNGEPVVDEPVDAELVTDVALVDDEKPADEAKWVHQSEWKYDWLDYKGDKLAIRVPHQNALTALFQAGQQCSPEFQAELTTKFVKRHISQESIERVLERMSDPDDEEYAAVKIGVWGDLLRIIANIGGDRATKDAEALAAVQSGKA
jgi:hypothetical protein